MNYFHSADIHDAALKTIDSADNRDAFNPYSHGLDDVEDIVLEKGNIVMLGPSGCGEFNLSDDFSVKPLDFLFNPVLNKIFDLSNIRAFIDDKFNPFPNDKF